MRVFHINRINILNLFLIWQVNVSVERLTEDNSKETIKQNRFFY